MLELSYHVSPQLSLIPLIPTSDQDIISPYNVNAISSRLVMRMKKLSIKGFSVDPTPNSPKQHRSNCMTDAKENYQ